MACATTLMQILFNKQEMIQEPVALVTGFYFPVRTLGGLGGSLASLIPMTLGLDAMRQLTLPGQWPVFIPVGWEIAIQAALAVLFMFGAAWSLRVIEHRAKIEGRLSLKWQ